MGFDWWREDADPKQEGVSVQELRARIEREDDLSGRGVVWYHGAPVRPLTEQQAHRITQLHRDCGPDVCPRKAAALSVLIAAGKVKPDSSRAY
ncbi:hypothetical protein [Nocardia transvalensis]|uniref:hypothetical protein n=1 Tax=Nocardia transvalensis TaxID=37333 RepID=UPI0018947ABA|nr:hypothetical protein [Nocardia transvalensis]